MTTACAHVSIPGDAEGALQSSIYTLDVAHQVTVY